MLQCIRLIGNGWAFRRVMTSPSNRVYVEECKSQKAQSVGDFVCQIKQIVDSVVDVDVYGDGGRGKGKWELIDISVSE